MTTAPNLAYPPDPSYGAGACRRRILLRQEARQVVATLDDNYHEMTCQLRHDGKVVTDIAAQTLRIPTSACPGAADVLRELVGMPLDIGMARLYGGGRARRHCTHLFDLAALAMAHVGCPQTTRRYDASVPDSLEGAATIEVWRDRQLVHAWQVQDDHIVAPAHLARLPLLSGFMAWAVVHFHGDELEAAAVLSKTYLISAGRRYQTEAFAGQSIGINSEMIGRCHSYSTAHRDQAVFLSGRVRDYSSGIPEK
jgi:hypothetical protein